MAASFGFVCTPYAEVTSLRQTSSQQEKIGAVTPLPASPSSAVYGLGKAPVYQGDVASARKIALQAAYADAIAHGTGIEVGSLTLIKNVSKVTDLVTSQSRGIVTSYTITHEEISPDGTLFTIGIDAIVGTRETTDETSRSDALRLLLGILGNPRILVLVPQYDTLPALSTADSSVRVGEVLANPGYIQSANATLPVGALRGTDAAFSRSLANHGYRTATPDMAVGKVDPDLLMRARSGETIAAIELAREIGADIVLIGSFSASTKRIMPRGVEFEAVSAEFSARTFTTATGNEVEPFFESATASHINRLAAISQVKNLLADRVAAQLAWRIPKILGDSPNILHLQVNGIDSQASIAVQSMLQRELDIESVELLRLPDQSRKAAEFELRTGFVRVAPAQLLELLNAHLGNPVRVIQHNPFFLSLKLEN